MKAILMRVFLLALAMCGVMTTLLSDKSGFVEGIGSGSKTSNPAAPNFPLTNAS